MSDNVIKFPDENTKNDEAIEEAVNEIKEFFDNKNIEILIYAAKLKDGRIVIKWTGENNYFERIGIAETLKQDMYSTANELI